MLGRVLKDLFAPRKEARPGQAAFEAGVVALQAGNHAAAAEHFAGALRADPEHVHAHHFAGEVAFQ